MEWRFFSLSGRRSDKPADGECGEIETLLSLYSDGMASAAEVRRVEAHLAVCEDCRKAHFWMRATNEVITHRPVVAPPVDMWARIQGAISEPAVAPVPVRLRFNPRPAYALAASIALAAAVLIPIAMKSHGEHARMTVATNSPAPSIPAMPQSHVAQSPAPPALLPIAPHAIVHHAAAHTPVQLASNAHEERTHAAGSAIVHRIELPRPTVHIAPHAGNTMLAKASSTIHELPSQRRAHAPSVDQRMAKSSESPGELKERATSPSIPVQPEQVAAVPANSNTAATATSTTSGTMTASADMGQATVAPVRVARHSHSLNDDLREAVRATEANISSRSTVVAAAYGAPTADSFAIVAGSQ